MQNFHPEGPAAEHRQFHQPSGRCHLEKDLQADFLSQQALWHALEIEEDS